MQSFAQFPLKNKQRKAINTNFQWKYEGSLWKAGVCSSPREVPVGISSLEFPAPLEHGAVGDLGVRVWKGEQPWEGMEGTEGMKK